MTQIFCVVALPVPGLWCHLEIRLTAHKRVTRNGDINHIAEHHLQTNHRIDWDTAKCVTYSTDYYQRITLESWFTNLERTPLNRCQQLPAPYNLLTYWRQQQGRQTIDKPTNFSNDRPTDIWLTEDGSKRTNHVLQSSQPKTLRLNWQTTNNIVSSSTNQDNNQRLTTSTDDSKFTWLWWWLPPRLSKRQSASQQTGLPSPGRSYFTDLYDSWVQIIYKIAIIKTAKISKKSIMLDM